MAHDSKPIALRALHKDALGAEGQASAPEVSSEQNSLLLQSEARAQSSGFFDWVDKWWLVESSAWFFSVLSLMGLVILLHYLNDSPAPAWSIQAPEQLAAHLTTSLPTVTVTINSVISIFTTAIKSTLLVPVTAALGQQKWLWFDKPRKLADFSKFDDANGGPLGSLLLILSMRGRRIACLGALIIISMLGLDFSFQQLVVYSVQSSQVGVLGNATMPRTTNFSMSALTRADRMSLNQKLTAAMWTGIWNLGNSSQFVAIPSCPTGNCTWPHEYTSLAVCAQCYNITDAIDVQCAKNALPTIDYPFCNATLPTGLNISEYNDQYLNHIYNGQFIRVKQSSSLTGGHVKLNQTQRFITSFATIIGSYSGNGTNLTLSDRSYSATECGLDFCVQKYNGSVDLGRVTERPGMPYIQNVSSLSFANGSTPAIYPPADFFDYTSESDSQHTYSYDSLASLTFEVLFSLTNNVASSLVSIWEGIAWGDQDLIESQDDAIEYSGTVVPRFFSEDSNGIAAMMDNLAAALTKVIREQDSPLPENAPALGLTHKDTVFINVRWGWLAPVVVLLLLSAIFLVSTVVRTQRHKAARWKNSSLVPFFYPLTKEARMWLRSNATTDHLQMEEVSDKLYVKYRMTEKGVRLVPAERITTWASAPA